MNRNISVILISILSSFFIFSSCVDELEEIPSSLGEGEGWLFMRFGAADAVQMSTKSTQTYATENAVNNIFVFIFGQDGSKLYGKWLTTNERMASEEYVKGNGLDCWYASNASDESEETWGCLKVKASSGNNLKVYLITNLDSDMVRISSDLLSHNISNESDLLKFKLIMNQETVGRNANFPMFGYRGGVNIIAGNDSFINEKDANPLMLKRLDAKIRFIFKTGTTPDAKGQTIKSFEANQWKVVNVPATSYVYESLTDSEKVPPDTPADKYAEIAPYFFDTDWRNFEDITTTTQEFSFYMLENRQEPKNSIDDYNERSRQKKNSSGQNESITVDYTNLLGKSKSKTIKLFQNANDFSTYVLVTGKVYMDLVDDAAGQTLGADVQYLIHLGSWDTTDVNDFNTLRNHSYTYTVTVNSVNNIRVEVEEGTTENQPGATGEVIIAKEEIALCDAHYVSKTLSFHARNFYTVQGDGRIISTADNLTWKVNTPFSEGGPIYKDGVDMSDHLDYNWVHFRLNKKDNGSYYSDRRRKYTPRVFEHKEIAQSNTDDDGTEGLYGYHNDGCMDIRALVSYIKSQVELYVDYYNKIVESDGNTAGITNESDFDNGKNVDGTDDPMGPKICVTVFVDEYYYDVHPISKVKEDDLWKQFVNKPDRTMHILCDSRSSTDLESTATGSVITIQQKSIQTIFNDDPSYTDLHTAWGLEHNDEYSELWLWGTTSGDFNTDYFNGFKNSMKLWDLCPKSAAGNTFITGQKWNTYLNIEVDNETPQLIEDGTHNRLRYSCMVRNRDNNGDGIIDRSEMRWYTASIRQLIGLYMAEGVITPSSRLYNRSASEKQDVEASVWMQHVISSTNESQKPIIVWAEEGISTGAYTGTSQEGSKAELSVRCIRNLGMDAEHPLDEIPEDYITKSYIDGHTVFTCTHINEASLRDYTSVELPLHAENSRENYLYKKFEVADELVQSDNKAFVDFNQKVTEAISNGLQNPYCPPGYRMPNQREIAIMTYYKLYASDGVSDLAFNSDGTSTYYMMSRTYWSFGYYATVNKKNNKTGFIYTGNICLQEASAPTTRCVRDIRVD